MSSPQLEDGYTRIANELLEAFARTHITGQERRIIDVVARKTYGYGKKLDSISYGQISKMTGIARTNVIPLVKRLVLRNILGSLNGETKKPVTLWINKNYREWLPSLKGQTSLKEQTSSSLKEQTKTSLKEQTHKRKKEKKEIPTNFLAFSKSFLEYQKQHFPTVVKTVTQLSIELGAKVVDELVRIDGFDFEGEIRPALKWAVKDEFWRENVHSLAGLRKKKDQGGLSKFQKIVASMNKSLAMPEENDPYANVPYV